MTFAHWTNKTVLRSRLLNPLAGSEHIRGEGPNEHVVCFVVDIPAGATNEDVVEKLRSSGSTLDDTDGLGFENEWPDRVRAQFEDKSVAIERWSWPTLH
jgi:hypothetical protein